MKILDRYVLRELMVPFLIGTIAVVLMFQANTLIFQLKTFSMSAVPPIALFNLILYKTPGYLNMTLPIGMSLAASLVLGMAVGAFLVIGSAPVQTVALRVERPENVRVMFNSAMPLQAATLHLALPENLELVGYRDQRELTWQADLREGGNLLQLPVIARGTVKDDLVARLSHGGSTKTFRVKFEVESASRLGM